MAVVKLRRRGRLFWRCHRCGWAGVRFVPATDSRFNSSAAIEAATKHEASCGGRVRSSAEVIHRWEFDGAA